MSDRIEIHGRVGCPFAWRARLVAAEKGVPFDWIPFDVDAPDPRAAAHNPERKSPLLVHDTLTTPESEVIAWYLDEAFDGPRLQPSDAQGRARMRLTIAGLAGVSPGGPSNVPISAESMARIERGTALLEEALADGRAFLGGDTPSLADLLVWPMVHALERKGVTFGDDRPRARAWWARAQKRPSFVATRP